MDDRDKKLLLLTGLYISTAAIGAGAMLAMNSKVRGLEVCADHDVSENMRDFAQLRQDIYRQRDRDAQANSKLREDMIDLVSSISKDTEKRLDVKINALREEIDNRDHNIYSGQADHASANESA